MKLPDSFKKLSFKVALSITLLVVFIFIFIGLVVVNQGTNTFGDVYKSIRNQKELPSENTPFIVRTPHGFRFFQPPPEVMETPIEHFRSNFQASLIFIGVAALLGAIGIGILISSLVARPLNKLSSGLKKLRQSNYRERLDEDKSEEFNSIIREFNSLAVELQRVEELRKNLISDTSHELKTPLASLGAQLEGIADGVLTLDKERVTLLRGQVARLADMVENLQDYARLRSQIIKPKLKKIILAELINRMTRQYQTDLNVKKITLHQIIPSDYSLEVDPALLERIFTNFFDNALRYAQAKNITIKATASVIAFADDGVGIPVEHQQDIFERFFRLDKSRSRDTGGLGLGLSIVREIVEAHGWKISAGIPENKQGVEFVIRLS